jgi:hypothetical protein
MRLVKYGISSTVTAEKRTSPEAPHHDPRVNIQSVARRGVQDADVITARLVQDECGWLRLAG